jgi:hypothetical protein
MSEQAHFNQAEENSRTQLCHNTPAQGKRERTKSHKMVQNNKTTGYNNTRRKTSL